MCETRCGFEPWQSRAAKRARLSSVRIQQGPLVLRTTVSSDERCLRIRTLLRASEASELAPGRIRQGPSATVCFPTRPAALAHVRWCRSTDRRTVRASAPARIRPRFSRATYSRRARSFMHRPALSPWVGRRTGAVLRALTAIGAARRRPRRAVLFIRRSSARRDGPDRPRSARTRPAGRDADVPVLLGVLTPPVDRDRVAVQFLGYRGDGQLAPFGEQLRDVLRWTGAHSPSAHWRP